MDAVNFPPVPFLDLKAQQARIGPELRQRLDAVLAHCQFILGPEVAELEAKLAAFCGAKHCVAVSSGTDALQIALMAEGIGRGDAVFLPAFTYTATAEVPLLLGATPVFVDVDPRTFQIDLDSLKARIAQVKQRGELRCRARHRRGSVRPARRLGRRCAPSPRRKGCSPWMTARRASAPRRMATGWARRRMPRPPASSPPSRSAPMAMAARCSPNRDERAALYRSLRTHGEGTTRYEVLRTGMNGRLDTMQAAVLLAKLEVFEGEIARREEIARIYDARLAGVVETPARVPDSAQSAWAVYSVLLPDAAQRDAARAALQAASIGNAVYYPRALHQQPAYAACHDGAALPVAESLGARILALPIHPDLTDEQAKRTAATLRAAVTG